MVKHTAHLDFPNGLGYTPCTAEYRRIALEVRDLNAKAHSDAGLTDEEYNRVNELENKLGVLSLEGHMGRPVRY